jgi:transcription elongation factor GreA
MPQYFFTEKGYLRLKDEIEKLDRLLKNDIAKEIGTAAAHGDLKENGEYHAAKEKQNMTAARLRGLQERFSGANVVRKDELLPEESVTFGKRVKIRETTTGAERECTILGDGEADPDQGIIAYNSSARDRAQDRRDRGSARRTPHLPHPGCVFADGYRLMVPSHVIDWAFSAPISGDVPRQVLGSRTAVATGSSPARRTAPRPSRPFRRFSRCSSRASAPSRRSWRCSPWWCGRSTSRTPPSSAS